MAEAPDAGRELGLWGALRTAAVDLYYQSIRLVPANLAWGAALVAIVLLAASGAWLAAVLAMPLLAVTFVAVARLAGLIVRREEAVLSDAWRAGRERAVPALIGGILTVGASAVLGTNLAVGLATATPVGLVLAVLAGWGLVGLWLTSLPFWTLLADPARAAWSATDVARLTALLLLARPAMVAGLGLVLAVVLLISAVLVAALLVVSVAYAALVTAHRVLAAADRLSVTSTRFPTVAVTPSTEPSTPD